MSMPTGGLITGAIIGDIMDGPRPFGGSGDIDGGKTMCASCGDLIALWWGELEGLLLLGSCCCGIAKGSITGLMDGPKRGLVLWNTSSQPETCLSGEGVLLTCLWSCDVVTAPMPLASTARAPWRPAPGFERELGGGAREPSDVGGGCRDFTWPRAS
mmetsp:Transcript_62448/g.183070  ORF Transcript_62448/g.183070 Transcript_62448/m.183070 type:complete len:157 (+) Transcript_62448:245-715(+)